MPWAHCTGRGSSWRWMEKNMNQWSILKKNHSGRLVIPLFLALSFLRCSMPRGELWEILRSYQPFTSCRTNDRVNGIRERGNIPPNSRIVAIWQLRWPECHVLHLESDRDNVNGTRHTRGAPGELLTPNRDLLSPLFLGQRWRELFTQRVLVHLFPKQPPPQRAGHPRPPIMLPKWATLHTRLETRKLRNNSFWIHFQSSLFQAKMCRRKKVLQESHHFGLLSWLPIGIAHPDGWTGRAARWRRSLFRSATSLALSVPKAGDGGKMRGREDQSRTWLGHAEMPPGMTTQENIR